MVVARWWFGGGSDGGVVICTVVLCVGVEYCGYSSGSGGEVVIMVQVLILVE